MYDDERRSSQRIQVEVPVHVGQEETVTRDVSWSGIYFFTEQIFAVGGDLSFSLDLTHALPGKTLTLGCQGEVIRVEQHDGKIGIAARINDFQYLH